MTSLVRVSVRVAMAVFCAAQHATPHSTAQHPCALQYNALQVYIYLALCWHHLGDNFVKTFWCDLSYNSNLGLINSIVIFKAR